MGRLTPTGGKSVLRILAAEFRRPMGVSTAHALLHRAGPSHLRPRHRKIDPVAMAGPTATALDMAAHLRHVSEAAGPGVDVALVLDDLRVASEQVARRPADRGPVPAPAVRPESEPGRAGVAAPSAELPVRPGVGRPRRAVRRGERRPKLPRSGHAGFDHRHELAARFTA